VTASDLARSFEERSALLPPVLLAFRARGVRRSKATRRLSSLLSRKDSK